jgi:putative DNA primase/helicase
MSTPGYNLDVALAFGGAGFRVFPCDATTKQPLVRWLACSSSHEHTIRHYFTRYPGAMVGLDLSKVGLVVFDFDRGHADGVDGCANFGALLDEYGLEFPFDRAPAVATPSGGYHVYLRQPMGREPLGNSNRNLPPGCDVRGHGGYTIAPGSVRSDGIFYDPAPDSPDLIASYVNGTIAEVPAWCIECIEWREPSELRCPSSPVAESDASERLKRVRKILELATNDLACMPPNSGRNAALNNQAMRFAGWADWCGISEREVTDSLMWACHRNGLVTEDGERACHATFKSGWTAGISRPLRPPRDRNADTSGIEIKLKPKLQLARA